MKKTFYLVLLIALIVSACKKSNNSESTMSSADETFYNNVIGLQNQAGTNFQTWVQSMDTLTAMNKVQQYFLSNSSVSSATVGSQGITVQYTNGMRGGIFINPEDNPGDSSQIGSFPKFPQPGSTRKSLVNNKQVIFLNPTYWERAYYANGIIATYNNAMPEVGFTLKSIYENQDATLDRFTQLSGNGIIHVYSHGLAYPDEKNIQEVYLLTGEVANLSSTIKYWSDIKNQDVAIFNVLYNKSLTGQVFNAYLITENFIASHNNFSKDTVLFYGGFCFSFLGSWDQLYTKFAKGAYFGFTWSVYTNWNAKWATSLIDSLADTLTGPAYNPEIWINGPNLPKSYYNNEDSLTVYIEYVGDGTLTFISPPSANFTWSPSSSKSSTQICLNSQVTVKDKSVANGFPITEWQWYFSNGNPDVYIGQQPPTITFNTLGSAFITLSVSNKFGFSSKQVVFNVVQCK
jgi:hypothetical protein